MKKEDKDISDQLITALNRLEYATELIKLWVGYMNTDLTDTEKMLVDKCKAFLGENND